MTFHKAVLIGLGRAQQVRRAQNEVSRLLDQISQAISEQVGLGVQLKMRESVCASSSGGTACPRASRGQGCGEHCLCLQSQVLALVTADNRLACNVAGWEQDVQGFPCTLHYEGRAVTCFSAMYLREALLDLLQSLWFGQRLDQLASSARDRNAPQTGVACLLRLA